MRQRSVVTTLLVLCGLFASAGSVSASAVAAGGPTVPSGPATPAAGPAGTLFNYQGRLNSGSTPFNGSCDMAFRLFDDSLTGSQVGQPVTTTVAVSAGYFTALLDFGGGVFTGNARWLDIRVKCGADPAFTPLSPRQLLTPAPYALALPGLFTQQNITSTTLIGGYGGNLVSGLATYGVTIGGGGEAGLANAVQGGNVAFATIGGGVGNVISGTNVYHSVIGGGQANTIGAASSVIGGGQNNIAAAEYAVVAGGQGNQADNFHSTVSGGYYNLADGWNATVAGGTFNHAGGTGAAVGGGGWDGVTQFGNQALGRAAAIGGGLGNIISATADYSVIAGGEFNQVTGTTSFIGGGDYNAAGGGSATVAGGTYNQAIGPGDTIGGGGWDGSFHQGNLATGSADTIAGGLSNTVSFYGSAVGGGQGNLATNNQSTVGGGYFNKADGWNATIGGGTFNHASGAGAFIGGGGWDGTTQHGNTAGGNASVVAGGLNNSASGDYAAVPGGSGNTAHGQYSFAAGHSATANNSGAFVWNCSGCPATSSAGADEFVINAAGGIYLGDGSNSGPASAFSSIISTSVGAKLTTGGVWTDNSDANSKTDFAPVDGLQVLDTLMAMPVQTWRYKVEDSGTRHMGPTAQDFFAAFSVGNDNTHLAALDTNGVALAAIQGLDQLVQTQKAQIEALQTRAAAQQQADAALQARLSALEQRVNGGPLPAPAAGLPLGWLLFGALALLNVGGLLGFLIARSMGARSAAGAQ